jgi:16S rRNA (uracil1498-N3)-methyltransferase
VSLPLFLAEPGSLAGVVTGALYRLEGDEGRHAAGVRRLRVGEAVEVADGAGTVVRGVVEDVGRESLGVRIGDRAWEPPPAVALVLVQALAKGDRDERAIEAATEVGVDVVVPWQAERSVSVWASSRQDRGERRWAAVVAAAAKQSRRSRVPEVRPLVRGSDVADLVASGVAAGSRAVVLDGRATLPLARVALPQAGDVLVVVGPEGGLTEAEVAALSAAGADVARLGPHVLRTSTAGPVALALLAERLGRWAATGTAR